MNLPVNIITWMGAAAPVILLIVLLTYLRWSVVTAAAVGVVVSVCVAFFIYDASAFVISMEALKGTWSSLSIIAVIFPAILIYEISKEINAFNAIQVHLTHYIPDRLLQVLAIGWGFSSFLQGPSGFGVPVAVTAPLLIGIGVKPLWSVIIALMAHAWANLFGTLALGWDALMQQVPLTGEVYLNTAWWSALLTGLLAFMAGFIICWQYGKRYGLAHGWIAVLVIGGIQCVGQVILSQYSPALSVVIPTTLALGATFVLAKLRCYAQADNSFVSPIFTEIPQHQQNQQKANMSLNCALLPYYLLVIISVCALLIEPVKQCLLSFKMGFAFPETTTNYGWINQAYPLYSPIAWLAHSSFFLLFSAVIAIVYYWYKGFLNQEKVIRALINSWKKFIPAAFSVLFLLIMSKVMSGSGQTYVLAEGTKNITGDWYVLLAPMVGTLGAFMASSSVSSNILFGQFQESMAELTGKSNVIILAGQGAGSAIGTMISPSKVLLAATTAGVFSQQGDVFRKLLVIAILASILMGIIVFAFS